MKKNISVVSKGLVIDVGSFKKSTIKGWVGICNKQGHTIGGLSLLENKFKVLHKKKIDGTLYVVYSLIDREGK